MSDRTLVGRCGMYCGSCPIYRAPRDKDEKMIFDISFRTRCTIDMIKCDGCGTPDRFALSKNCIFRRCSKGRGIEHCSLCNEFPCETLLGLYEDDMRSMGEAEKNARRIKDTGIDKWLEEADSRWHCGQCGARIALDMGSCPGCKADIRLQPRK
jgi:hypothetical protein